MAYRLPNGAYFYIEDTPTASIIISALSNAENAVATLPTGHSVAEGDDVVVFSGWGDVDGLSARVIDVTDDKVTLGGIDTSDMTRFPAGAGVGSLRRASENFVQIDQNVGVADSGGEQQYRTISPLERDTDIQLPTSRSPRTKTLTLGDDPKKAWHAALLRAAKSKQLRALKLVFPWGDSILYSGYVGYDGIATTVKNEEMQVTASFAINGTPLRYDAPN